VLPFSYHFFLIKSCVPCVFAVNYFIFFNQTQFFQESLKNKNKFLRLRSGIPPERFGQSRRRGSAKKEKAGERLRGGRRAHHLLYVCIMYKIWACMALSTRAVLHTFCAAPVLKGYIVSPHGPTSNPWPPPPPPRNSPEKAE